MGSAAQRFPPALVFATSDAIRERRHSPMTCRSNAMIAFLSSHPERRPPVGPGPSCLRPSGDRLLEMLVQASGGRAVREPLARTSSSAAAIDLRTIRDGSRGQKGVSVIQRPRSVLAAPARWAAQSNVSLGGRHRRLFQDQRPVLDRCLLHRQCKRLSGEIRRIVLLVLLFLRKITRLNDTHTANIGTTNLDEKLCLFMTFYAN